MTSAEGVTTQQSTLRDNGYFLQYETENACLIVGRKYPLRPHDDRGDVRDGRRLTGTNCLSSL